MAELNIPSPEPSLVLVERATVGFALVDQTVPLTVTGDLPSEEIFPPDIAPLVVIDWTEVVVSIGILAVVVKKISFP
jgi:hypothetical protein